MIGPQLSSHLLFLPESWKWKIARKNERKLILEGPMFHWTMIMGGRGKDFECHVKIHNVRMFCTIGLLPLDPKTMKNEGFTPPIYEL